MNDPLIQPFHAGAAEPREGPATWCAIALLTISFVTCLVLTWILIPHSGGGASLREAPMAVGSWDVAWGAGVTHPNVEQESQVRALRQVAGGVSGILTVLALLIVTGLWRQRLLLRRQEYYVHWAVGARRRQLASRLTGQASRWGVAIAVASLAASALLPALIVRTFPGEAGVPPGLAAGLMAFAGLVVILLRWESRAGERAATAGRTGLSDWLASPGCVSALGFASLTAVGLLSAHAPGSNRGGAGAVAAEAAIAGISLGHADRDRAAEVVSWIGERARSTGPLGIASAGTARGAGVATRVWVDCGRCFEGGLPLPIRTVRAEVHAVARDTFPHLGVRVESGRDFGDDDGEVAIVSRAMASRHFEGGAPLGRKLRIGDDTWVTVVGVVSDRPDVRDHLEYAVYLPLIEAAPSEIEVIGQVPGTTLREALVNTPPGVLVGEPRTIAQLFGVHTWFARLVGATGVLAYMLVLMGVWLGRWHEVRALGFEIALRKAVGARHRDLLTHFARTTLRNVVVFVAVGAWLSLFFTKALSMAYGPIPGVDPTVWLSVGIPIVAAYVIGSWGPYAQAMRVRPAVGLRGGG